LEGLLCVSDLLAPSTSPPDAADESGTFIDVDDSSDNETMVEAMSRIALAPSKERAERDSKALVWTVKSLADDAELEPFVEAIPDLLWGPDYRRHTYEPHIRGLIHNSHVQLLDRIATLLQSCYRGILSSDVRTNSTKVKCELEVEDNSGS
jgi:hypothetical protein